MRFDIMEDNVDGILSLAHRGMNRTIRRDPPFAERETAVTNKR